MKKGAFWFNTAIVAFILGITGCNFGNSSKPHDCPVEISIRKACDIGFLDEAYVSVYFYDDMAQGKKGKERESFMMEVNSLASVNLPQNMPWVIEAKLAYKDMAGNRGDYIDSKQIFIESCSAPGKKIAFYLNCDSFIK